ncbi:armadillo-type protein [Mycena metata]|uniref:Armadillo-type protein n=1 Tax=Mycena metata TaxID=1033252 RepID=A0AAD7JQ51_9AGAR|nr:armadillo-type protein [Mycena metata]
MPPLTRQRTPQSLHSEWSRNSLGATISIHAIAKPLMKVMYHRAVLDLIKRQQGVPLSAETMQIYASYLGWKYVADTTKAVILSEISKRAQAEAEARVVADFLLSYDIFLDSTNVVVRSEASWIFGWVAFHSSTREAVLAVRPYGRLVTLLGDRNVAVVTSACRALAEISRDVNGARAVVDAGVLEIVEQLLESPEAGVRRWTSELLAQLAVRPSTRRTVVAVHPCAQLVALLRDRSVTVVTSACCALAKISRGMNGARAVVDAGVLEIVGQLLKSPDAGVQRWTSRILGHLASHPSTRGLVVAVQPCAQLVALLGGGDEDVVEAGCHALWQISLDLDGAIAVVKAEALELLKQMLKSLLSTEVRQSACWTLGVIASHWSTRGAVVALQSCAQLVALLGDGNEDVVEGACYALSQISLDLNGTRAIVEAGGLELLEQMLQSPYTEIRKDACLTLACLAYHSPTREAVLAGQLCAQFVALLGDDYRDVVERTCLALPQISRDLDGARAVVEAEALDFVQRLLKSSGTGVRESVCWTLARLVFYSSTREVVLAVQPYGRLVALLGDGNEDVVEGACYALSQVSDDLEGAMAVVKAGALNFVPHLIQSPGADVRKYTCLMLAQLSHHDRVPPSM